MNRQLLLLVLVLCTALFQSRVALAQSDRELEGWQQRILQALEKAEDSREGQRDNPRDDQRVRSAGERQSLSTQNGRDPGASAAAARAQSRYGGRVLAVMPTGSGYRVRLLLDDGRVTTVDIRD